MKAMICEMCNSNDLVKQDGMFVCQHCGTKYSVEEAKKMMIEGTVDVSGSTVKIDKREKINNLLVLAESSFQGGDSESAVQYAEQVLVEESDNYKAWIIKAKAAGYGSTLKNPKITQSITAAKKAIELAPKEAKTSTADSLAKEIGGQLISMIDLTKMLAKENFLGVEIYPYYKTIINYWNDVLQLPNISKDEIRRQIGLCETLYIMSKNSKIPSERSFHSSCIVNNNSVPYYITMKQRFLPEDVSEKEKNQKEGCYVATSVYGSYDCPEVWTLRRFRDNTLATTWYGRAFIHTYYSISPTLVKWFGDTTWFNNMWKPKLDRMVKHLRDQGVEDTPYDDKRWGE